MQELLRQFIHYFLHIVFPGIIAYFFYPLNWKKVWLIMILSMAIDLDHLFSNPVFDADRCSINYHFLHTYYAGIFYLLLFCLKKTRIVGLAAILHLLADIEDCLWI